MSIEIMEQWIDKHGDKSIGAGATLSEITAVEQTLEIIFPESYRSFLNHYSWARFAQNEIYGIGSNIPIHMRLLQNTIAERQKMCPQMKHSLVPVLNDGSGNYFCLETELMKNGECPIVFWDHDKDGNQEPIYESETFALWLVDYFK